MKPLVISPTQHRAFAAAAEAAFLDRLTVQLTQDQLVSTRRLSRGQLRLRVAEAVQTGRGLGLVWASSLAAFATLSVVFGPDFHRHTQIRRVLEERDDTPDHRFLRLSTAVSDRAWREAANAS